MRGILRRRCALPAHRLLTLLAAASITVGQGNAMASPEGPAKPVQCDPHRDDINAAIKLRDRQLFKQARKAVQALLDQDPDDFRSNFIMATILISAETRPSLKDAGIGALLKSETLLPVQPPGCNERYGWYSLYNTLGAQYYKRNDLSDAERYLTMAYAHIDYLYPQTKRELLINLGILRVHQGRLEEGLKFYEQAQQAGSKSAARNVETLKKLLKLSDSVK